MQEKEQTLSDRILATSEEDRDLAGRLFPESVVQDECFADRLFTNLLPSCAILCYDAFYQGEKKERTRSESKVDYVVWVSLLFVFVSVCLLCDFSCVHLSCLFFKKNHE